jgi:hypothetical protein
MTLSPSYLKYAKRKHGQDHDLYKWRMVCDRDRLVFIDGKKVAISFIVPLEYFPLNPTGVPFKHPGAMQTAYPDLRHYTVRDYGNRVGVYRVLGAFSQFGLRATFAVNGEIARRYAPLMDAVKEGQHEIVAHGLSTDHIHHEGLSASEEQGLIKQTLACFDSLPKGWLSPARTQSSKTIEHLAKAGIEYCLDWEMDQVPTPMDTKSGSVLAVPMFNELSDFTLLHTRKQTEESWLKQITDAVDFLVEEYDQFGAQSLAIRLTPYIIGQPFRIWALRSLLAELAGRSELWVCPAGDLSNHVLSGE